MIEKVIKKCAHLANSFNYKEFEIGPLDWTPMGDQSFSEPRQEAATRSPRVGSTSHFKPIGKENGALCLRRGTRVAYWEVELRVARVGSALNQSPGMGLGKG